MANCICCGKNTNNPKFCSRSCSAKTTNKIPKRHRQINYCKSCGKETGFFRRKFCSSCNPMNKDWSTITYSEATSKRKYQKNSRIRNLARRIYKSSDKPQCCMICGYNKHFEVCHIKSISSFPNTATISEINHIDNLIALCPNHHWELDHSNLILPEGFAPSLLNLEG